MQGQRYKGIWEGKEIIQRWIEYLCFKGLLNESAKVLWGRKKEKR